MAFEIEYLKLTPAEAKAYLGTAKNTRGKFVFIQSSVTLAVDRYRATEETPVKRTGFDHASSVEVTKASALRWLNEIERQHGHRNPKLSLGIASGCIFLGSLYHIETDPDC